MKPIVVSSDHAGFALKEFVKEELKKKDFSVIDVGAQSAEKREDYPLMAKALAKKIQSGECDRGVLVCGSGIGISTAANVFFGIRATLCTDKNLAELARKHNNSNVLSMGGRTTKPDVAKEILDTWLNTEFEGGRHTARLEQIEKFKGEEYATSKKH